MFNFGPGVLMGFRTDVANSTPVNFGLVQEVTTDLSFNSKSLYGEKQFPQAIARGTGKFTGKAKMARISGLVFASLFFGTAIQAGQLLTAYGEAGVVPSTPFSVTVANGATFVDDLGVVDATTGLPLTKVATGPATGEYSVAAGGVYTFAAADTGKAVLISYTYTVPTTGEKIVFTNPLLGTTPTFQANFYSTFQGNAMTIKLPNCVSNKLSVGAKLEDFMIPELDFDIFGDAAGNVLTWSFGDKA